MPVKITIEAETGEEVRGHLMKLLMGVPLPVDPETHAKQTVAMKEFAILPRGGTEGPVSGGPCTPAEQSKDDASAETPEPPKKRRGRPPKKKAEPALRVDEAPIQTDENLDPKRDAELGSHKAGNGEGKTQGDLMRVALAWLDGQPGGNNIENMGRMRDTLAEALDMPELKKVHEITDPAQIAKAIEVLGV